MAKNASSASGAATEHTAAAAATEHSNETRLSELLNQESGQTGAYEMKAIRAEIVDYSSLGSKSKLPLKSSGPLSIPQGRGILPWRRKASEAGQERITADAQTFCCRHYLEVHSGEAPR